MYLVLCYHKKPPSPQEAKMASWNNLNNKHKNTKPMKKNSIFAAIALLCLLVSSCSDTLNEPVLETKNDIEYHGVPVEDALEYLNAFLATNDESTR